MTLPWGLLIAVALVVALRTAGSTLQGRGEAAILLGVREGETGHAPRGAARRRRSRVRRRRDLSGALSSGEIEAWLSAIGCRETETETERPHVPGGSDGAMALCPWEACNRHVQWWREPAPAQRFGLDEWAGAVGESRSRVRQGSVLTPHAERFRKFCCTPYSSFSTLRFSFDSTRGAL